MKTKIFCTMILIAIFVSACGGKTEAASITIENAWVRAAQMGSGMGNNMATPMAGMEGGNGANSAAYMLIKNSSSTADKLLKAESDVAMMVETHLSEMKDGVMTMHEVEGIEVPAKGQVELKPGSYHVMLMGLKRDLNAGDKVTLTLTFEKAGKVVIEAEVRNP